jgi:hypothetical protein
VTRTQNHGFHASVQLKTSPVLQCFRGPCWASGASDPSRGREPSHGNTESRNQSFSAAEDELRLQCFRGPCWASGASNSSRGREPSRGSTESRNQSFSAAEDELRASVLPWPCWASGLASTCSGTLQAIQAEDGSQATETQNHGINASAQLKTNSVLQCFGGPCWASGASNPSRGREPSLETRENGVDFSARPHRGGKTRADAVRTSSSRSANLTPSMAAACALPSTARSSVAPTLSSAFHSNLTACS